MKTNARKDRIRKRMYKKQAGLCWICGETMAISKLQAGKPRYATFDHLLPRADGGSNVQANIRLAHQQCNNLRGTLPAVNVMAALQLSQTEGSSL